MDLSDVFQSDSLKAADLNGKDVTATIESFEVVDFDDGKKIVLHFVGADKTLVCNKTNANTIGDMYGSKLEGWLGKKITLFPTQTDYQGRQVACIRVKIVAHASETVQVPHGASGFADGGNESPF